jgi:carboxyl-terminal processing protease
MIRILAMAAALAVLVAPPAAHAQLFGGSRGAPKALGEALSAVDAHYPTAPDFSALRLGALQALQRQLPEGQFVVSRSAAATQVTYAGPGGGPVTVSLSGSGREGTFKDLTAMYQAARAQTPSLDPAAVEVAMIKGLLSGLDGGGYLDREAYRSALTPPAGRFGGVGMEIAIRDGQLVVVAPIDGGPAARAGTVSGDRIVVIDGKATLDMSLPEAVGRLRGAVGSKVTIEIQSADGGTKTLALVRETIQLPGPVVRDMEEGILYIGLRLFQERTGADLRAELSKRAVDTVRGLVLDLRGNPGGARWTYAVEVGDLLFPGGVLLFSTEGRAKDQATRFVTTGQTRALDVPVVVLVNRGSAAVSEVLAGAVQDHTRGVVLGQPTAGVAAWWTFAPLPDGAGLRLPSAWIVTPKGRRIQGAGITPDLLVDGPPIIGPDGSDPQLRRALEEIKRRAKGG